MAFTKTVTLSDAPKAVADATALPTGPLDPLLGKVLARILHSDVKDRFATGTDPKGVKWKPLKHARPRGGNQPLRDTGRLMASFQSRYDGDGFEVSTVYPGAGLHNFGGVVRPTKAKYLAIPVTKEAVRSGGPRRFKGTLSVRATKKRGVLLLVGGKGNAVQFILVKSATIPQREFMGVSEKGWGLIGEAAAEWATKKWTGTA